MGQAEVESEHGTSLSFYDKLLPNLVCPKIDVSTLTQISTDGLTQMHLLVQAQMLIKKNAIYQIIDRELRSLSSYQPNVFYNVPRREEGNDMEREWQGSRDEFVSSFDRDLSINNLRLLCIFYDCGPNVLSLATNFLDRLLGQTEVHMKSLSLVVVCCFYIAVSFDDNCFVCVNPHDLMRLVRCETTHVIFGETTKLIMNCVLNSATTTPVTPLSLLRLFYDVFSLQNEILEDRSLKAFTVNRLEIILSRFQFTKFRYDILALALLNYILQGLSRLDPSATLSTIIELQYYSQMNLDEYCECFSLIGECLREYHNQKTIRPTQKVSWVLSRRVLQKMRPSTLVDLKLEPVIEEEEDKMDDNGADDDVTQNVCEDFYFACAMKSPEDVLSSEEEEEEEEEEEIENDRYGDDFQMYEEKYFEMPFSSIFHSDTNNNQVIM